VLAPSPFRKKSSPGSPPLCRVYTLSPGHFSCVVESAASLADVSKELVAPERLSRLSDLQCNAKYENVVHGTVVMGARTNIGANCYVGEGVVFGEKCTVKKSVIGEWGKREKRST
jgi:translation initiation factor eIF-2B subunit gamma